MFCIIYTTHHQHIRIRDSGCELWSGYGTFAQHVQDRCQCEKWKKKKVKNNSSAFLHAWKFFFFVAAVGERG